MLIKVTHTGTMDHHHEIRWPYGWPPPIVGDDISIPALPEVTNVRVVEWLPEGDKEDARPFVYVVVGPKRKNIW